MVDLARQVEVLEHENERLREEIAALRGMPAGLEILPRIFALTAREETVLAFLLAKEVVTKDQIHFALYGGEVNGGAEPKIVDVFICKIRKKLKPFEIEIETVWGRGYQMMPNMKARLRGFIPPIRPASALPSSQRTAEAI